MAAVVAATSFLPFALVFFFAAPVPVAAFFFAGTLVFLALVFLASVLETFIMSSAF